MNTKYYLGVDIGGTKCAVVRGDSEGHILEKTRFDTRDCAATVARILDTAAAMAESACPAGWTFPSRICSLPGWGFPPPFATMPTPALLRNGASVRARGHGTWSF